ncbi:hypothetical protein GCM10020256_50400 [Streptomyces thermocoprophilus]
MSTPTAHIASIGTALPGDPVDNASLAKVLGVNEEWIEVFIGTKTRHFARDLGTGEVRWSLADLCAQAAQKALAAPGVDPADIEFIVLGTATPDTLMPATVNQVADQLGLDQVPTFQLQSGCAGAIQALSVGQTMIASGQYRTGLVIGGDVCSKHLDVQRDLSGAAPQRPRQLRPLRRRRRRRRPHRRTRRAARRPPPCPQPLHRARPQTRPGHRMVRPRRPPRRPAGPHRGLQGHRGTRPRHGRRDPLGTPRRTRLGGRRPRLPCCRPSCPAG